MSASSPPPASPGLRAQLLRECTEMVRYTLSSGMRVPPALVETVERYAAAPGDAPPPDLTPLVTAHERLSRIVAPATPRALVLFAEETDNPGRLRALGPVRLVRRMMLAGLLSVAIFILSSLSGKVNAGAGGVLDAQGLALLTNEVFWLASAGVGASFAMLFQVNEYIVNRSYDPKYEASYWIKFMIGVIAGFILVALVPLGALGVEGGEAGGMQGLAKPTLAMLGGFSAPAVYRILNRVMGTIESLFRGDPREEAALREQASSARSAEEASHARLSLASRLVELRQQAAAGGDPQALSRQIGELIASLVPVEAEAPQEPAADGARKVPVPVIVGAPAAGPEEGP